MTKLYSECLRIRRLLCCALALLLATVIASPISSAQNMIVYPAKGQSQEQQQRDRYECHSWAVGQTGFDPSTATAAAPPPPPPQGGVIRGAGRGAAIGAVGGAIGGNAGKGAAIGAATGAMVGGLRQRDQRRQQEAAQSQQNSAAAAQSNAYNRALSACLQGRGYTVN